MLKLRFALLLVLFTCISVLSCQSPDQKIKKEALKTNIDLKLVRFDQELFNHAQNPQIVHAKYPAFFNFYCTHILPDEVNKDSATLFHFLTNVLQKKDLQSMRDTINKHFPNFEKDYMPSLKEAMQMHHYYFPKTKIPTVYTFFSEFSVGCFTDGPEVLGIGLDLFLGPKFPVYDYFGIPYFIKRNCVPEKIIPNAMKAYAKNFVPEDEFHHRLIDKMVAEGKILYYLDRILPEAQDSVKMDYSAYQLKWCKTFEYRIWEYMIKYELLYKTDRQVISDFMNISPVTPGMPSEAPGMLGVWVGWQIVKKYMELNPKTSLEDLFRMTDGRVILEGSKYKPSKQ